MKAKRIILLMSLFIGLGLWAAPVTEATAAKAIGNWRVRRGQLGTKLGAKVRDARRVDHKGAAFHVVRFEGGGYAVTPVDTTIRPVIMFSDGDDFKVDERNPALALLAGELGANDGDKAVAAAAVPKDCESDWAALLADELPLEKGGKAQIDVIYVEPILKTSWDQDYVGGKPCFNYYTPSNYVCGCVATAGSQILRTLRFPNTSVTQFVGNCSVDGTGVNLTSQGGVYDWDNMPENPTYGTLTEAQRQAIGKLTSDVGISVGMGYAADGSGSGTYRLQYAFKNFFGIAHVSFGFARNRPSAAIDDTMGEVMRANFDAKLPVAIGIRAHSIVGDGYGYLGDTLYYHLNMGWGPGSNVWYAPPDDFGSWSGFEYACHNIYTNAAMNNLVIASGRLTDSHGEPVEGVTVWAEDSVGARVGDAVQSDAHGIYALFVPPGKYRVRAEGVAYDDIGHPLCRLVGETTASPVKCSTVETVKDGTGWDYWDYEGDYVICGNDSGCDMTLEEAELPPDPVLSEAPAWWYSFDRSEMLEACGSKYIAEDDVKNGGGCSFVDSGVGGRKAMKLTGSDSNAPYGTTSMNYGSGAWSVVSRVKFPSASARYVAWSIGNVVSGKGGALVCLADTTENKIGFSFVTDSNKTIGDSVYVAVSDAYTKFHSVGGVYDRSTSKLSVYVDGVSCGQLSCSGFLHDAGWQWFSVRGGLPSGMAKGTDVQIDDWRMYHRALSANEFFALHNSAETGEPTIWPGYLTSSDLLIWPGVDLANVTNVVAMGGGKNLPKAEMSNYYFENNGQTASVQFQAVVNSSVRCVKVLFTQKADGVWAKYLYARYKENEALGFDFDTQSGWTTYDLASNINVKGYGIHSLRAQVRAGVSDRPDYVWKGGDENFTNLTNWAQNGGSAAPESLMGYCLGLSENDETNTFSYVGYDPVINASGRLKVDGAYAFPTVGGFYFGSLVLGATGRLVYDPTVFTFRFKSAPSFAAGAKFALPAKYAANTKGRFLLMTWDSGSIDGDFDLDTLFDAASAQGTDVKVWQESVNDGGRLWLDLDHSGVHQKINVAPVGDSITRGYDSTYGNWRTLLMKRLAALGYDVKSTGFWDIESHDICGAAMPSNWIWHSGIGSQGARTFATRYGMQDAIENFLDIANDVDVMLLKLGTNDTTSQSPAATTFAAWSNVVVKALAQKPNMKIIAATILDQAFDATRNATVVAYNRLIRDAVTNGVFGAGRVYLADFYEPCYRYDGSDNYKDHSYKAANDVHPDWPTEDIMADIYLASVTNAIALNPSWQLGAEETKPTATGIANNVPSEFRSGYKCAGVFDVATHNGTALTIGGAVPYEEVDAEAATTDLSRVGYYIELKRKSTIINEYRGMVRYLWVSADAFGDRDLAQVGVPLNKTYQNRVSRLRVCSNMPGIANTTANEEGETGYLEFWPYSYTDEAAGPSGAPAEANGLDWNDTNKGTGSYGSMQVHRMTPNGPNEASVLFAFNRWTRANSIYELGLGNLANYKLGSIDWTFTGDLTKSLTETLSANAYEVARIEVWTLGVADDPDARPATITFASIGSSGGVTTVNATVDDFGVGASSADVTLVWSDDPSFATTAGTKSLGTVSALGAISARVDDLEPGKNWYFRFLSTNNRGKSGAVTSDPFEIAVAYWRPQSSSDTWESVAWKKNGAGENVAFMSGWGARFDNDSSVATRIVTVNNDWMVGGVNFALGNYTLAGAGKLTTGTVTKRGNSTLTVNGAGFAGPAKIDVEVGTLKLGTTGTNTSLGELGEVRVHSGASFDVNYPNSGIRYAATQATTFRIAGTGVDNAGAIYNKGGDSSDTFSHVVLDDDAMIGGTKRVTICRKTDVATPVDRATLDLGDHTLTVKNTAGYGLTVMACDVGGEGIVVDGGVLFPRNGATFALTNGVTLTNGGTLYLGQDADVALTVAGTGKIYSYDTNGDTFSGTVTVAAGATLTHTAEGKNKKCTTFAGTIQLDAGSTLANTASACSPITGTLKGTGTLTGRFRFSAGSVWEMTGTAQAVAAANVAGVTDSGFLAGLGKVKMVFCEVPTRGKLVISDAGVLADGVENVPVAATGPDGTALGGWSLAVERGKLCLVNAKMRRGFALIVE